MFPSQIQQNKAHLLELTAVFKVSAAFFIWFSFSLGTVNDHKALARVWQPSAEIRAAEVALGRVDYDQELRQFLDLHPADELPVVALHHSGYPYVPSNSEQMEEDLCSENQGILHLLNEVVQLKVDMGIDVQAATVPWNQTHGRPDQPTESDIAAVQEIYKHMSPLRAAVLLLKLISLASSAKGTADIQLAMWYTLELLGGRIQEVHSLTTVLQEMLDSTCSDGYDDEQFLCAQLTQLALPLLRQSVTSDELKATVSCQLLAAVLQATKPAARQVIAAMITESGMATASCLVSTGSTVLYASANIVTSAHSPVPLLVALSVHSLVCCFWPVALCSFLEQLAFVHVFMHEFILSFVCSLF